MAVTEEERVFTARETEMAERRKAIDLIGARRRPSARRCGCTVAAQAERSASDDRGAAVRSEAEAEADADKIRSLAARIRHEVEAEGVRLMNEAQNTLTPEARLSAMRMRLIDKIEGIIRESVQARWSASRASRSCRSTASAVAAGGRGEGFEGGGGSFADNVVNSALRYRAQAPLVDQLLREIGVDGGDVGKLARGMLDRGPAAPQLSTEPAPPAAE